MNLTCGNWIPVVRDNGALAKVSLLEVFQHGDRIRDLAVRPHERISIMRLLICIAQAALDGPKNRKEWENCQKDLPQAATDYLAKWRHAFELFGDGQRFLQVEDLKPAKDNADDNMDANSPSKLDFALATGNNSTLFDNGGGSDRIFPGEALALGLLSFQNFSPGGLIGDVKWNGACMGRQSNHAPCIVKSMLHTYIREDCLAATLHANLLCKDHIETFGFRWGMPVWEMMPTSAIDQRSVENATRTYLGRLVPLSRAIRLNPDGKSMLLGTALIYDPEWREVAATMVIRDRNNKPERTTLSGSLTKSIWREAHSISVLTTADSQMVGGPLALHSINHARAIDLWCGALAASKSKLLDSIEAVLRIPGQMFADAGQRLYRQGVKQAEGWAGKLGRAVSAFHRELKDELDRAEGSKRGALVKQKAASHYWTAIEQKVPLLLALVSDPKPLFAEGSTRENWGGTDWGRALAVAAREAYDMACPHETPRQMKAYTLGMNTLFKPVETEQDDMTDEENDE